jgi:hypothetical protein
MKKHFLLIVGLVFSFSLSKLSAQGNLQFSQVKLIGTTTETIPVGKVWKVESFIYSTAIGSVSSSLTQNDNIIVNGQTVTVRSARSGNGGYSAATYHVWEQTLPMWLTEGTTLQASTNVYRISAIEYNVIP